MSIVIYNSKVRMDNMILSRVLVIPCEVFLRDHLVNIRRISLLGSARGVVGVLEDAL